MNVKTTPPNEVYTDPLSYFASASEKAVLEQRKKKQDKVKGPFSGKGDPAYRYYITREDDDNCNIITRWESDDDDDDKALDILRLEREVLDLKVQIAQAKAEEDNERALARRLKIDCYELRRDIDRLKKIQRLNSEDMNGILKRCLQNIIEDNMIIQQDIDAMKDEVRKLQRMFWLYGVDPCCLDFNDFMPTGVVFPVRTSEPNLNGSRKSPRRESDPLRGTVGTKDKNIEAPLSAGIRRHSTGNTPDQTQEYQQDQTQEYQQDQTQEYQQETREDGFLVASSLLWD